MTHFSFVFLAYAFTFTTVGFYTTLLLKKDKKLRHLYTQHAKILGKS